MRERVVRPIVYRFPEFDSVSRWSMCFYLLHGGLCHEATTDYGLP